MSRQQQNNQKPSFTLLDETAIIGTNINRKPTETRDGKTIDNPNFVKKEKYQPPNLNFTSSNPASVRNAIAQLYDGFVMTKTQNHGSWGIYKALVDSLTGGESKFLVAIVPNDSMNPLGMQAHISDLPWHSFQTRTTKNVKLEFGGLPSEETFKTPFNK